jgi:tellurite resistance protein
MNSTQSLLGKVAQALSEPPSYTAREGATGPDDEEVTQPTGFDPSVAALFEAVVESAFLVADADGDFDDTERHAFKQVVVLACSDKVTQPQIAALLADLENLVKEDGVDKRVSMVAKTIRTPEHAREVLRISALIARVSKGVSEVERNVLEKLRSEFGLETSAVDAALREVELALAD